MTRNKLLIALFAISIISAISIPAYAQEPIQINTEINLTQALIILSIGLVAAVITSLEGMQKTGSSFDFGKFLIAVKRTAVISVPATFAMLALYPNPSISAYFVIGITIILGAKMQHTKPDPRLEEINEKLTALDTATTSTPRLMTVSTSIPDSRKSLVIVPKLGPEDDWYQTNFVKTKDGNALQQGKDLWIRVYGVRSYLTAILRNEAGNIIQIDQSNTHDEDGDIETTRLEMYGRDGKPLPKGKYKLQIQGDFGTSDAQGIKNDEFIII